MSHRVPKTEDRVTYHGPDGDVPGRVIAADRYLTALIYNDYTLGVGLYNLAATHGTELHQWRWPDTDDRAKELT